MARTDIRDDPSMLQDVINRVRFRGVGKRSNAGLKTRKAVIIRCEENLRVSVLT
jgi:hypothetical protein